MSLKSLNAERVLYLVFVDWLVLKSNQVLCEMWNIMDIGKVCAHLNDYMGGGFCIISFQMISYALPVLTQNICEYWFGKYGQYWQFYTYLYLAFRLVIYPLQSAVSFSIVLH